MKERVKTNKTHLQIRQVTAEHSAKMKSKIDRQSRNTYQKEKKKEP